MSFFVKDAKIVQCHKKHKALDIYALEMVHISFVCNFVNCNFAPELFEYGAYDFLYLQNFTLF